MKTCSHNPENIKYNHSFNSQYCQACDQWLDDRTDVTEYLFETPRPAKPSEAIKLKERL